MVSKFMRFLFFSPSRMSQPKFTAILRGEVLQDVATGQLFKLHPSEEELRGVSGSTVVRLMGIGGTL